MRPHLQASSVEVSVTMLCRLDETLTSNPKYMKVARNGRASAGLMERVGAPILHCQRPWQEAVDESTWRLRTTRLAPDQALVQQDVPKGRGEKEEEPAEQSSLHADWLSVAGRAMRPSDRSRRVTSRLGGSAFETLTHKCHRPPAARCPPASDPGFAFELSTSAGLYVDVGHLGPCCRRRPH